MLLLREVCSELLGAAAAMSVQAELLAEPYRDGIAASGHNKPGAAAARTHDRGGCYVPRRHVFTLCGFLAVTITMVASTISLAIVPISRELGWTDVTKGVVLSAYFYGYSPCCAVGGALALRFNRPTAQIFLLPLLVMAALSAVLPAVVTRLSCASDDASTSGAGAPGCTSHAEASMFAILLAMGMVQATLNPALHRMISAWSPVGERSMQHNLIYSGQQAGQVLGGVAGGVIIDALGWPFVFYINAAALAIFAGVWALLIDDSPKRHRGCSAAERRLIEADAGPAHEATSLSAMPWREILATPAVLVLFVNHWVAGWSSSTIMQWTPTWLSEELGFDIKHSGFISALPPLVGFVVATVSGMAATHLILRGRVSVGAVRKISQCGATLGAAFFLLLMVYVPNISRGMAISLMMVSYGFNSLQYTGFHVNHIDLTPRFAPLLYGVTNSVANTACVIAPSLYGHILGARHSHGDWQVVYTISAGVQIVGGLLWLAASSGERQKWG
jgi:sugar phosphate permease